MSQNSPPPSYRSAPSLYDSGFIGCLDERSPLVPVAVARTRKRQRDSEVGRLFLVILVIALLSAVAIGGSIHLYNDSNRLPSLQREIDEQRQKHIRDLKDMDDERRHRIEDEDKEIDARKQKHIRDLKDMDDERRRRIEYEDKEIERRRAQQTHEIQRRLDELRQDAKLRAAAKLYWGDLVRDETCSAWKERSFSAELINLPNGVDGVSWCLLTSIDIFGTTYPAPTHCSQDKEGRVFGHWIVKNDPTCRTYWENHHDMGCHDGARLIEAKLANHQPGYGTWREMCLSTPSHFEYADQGTPQICFVAGNDGIHGSWFIQDEECA